MRRREFLLGSLAAAVEAGKLEDAAQLVEQACSSKDVGAAVLDVRQDGKRFVRACGLAKTPDTVFLLASITKPMTAAGVMILADRGQLSLSDPVQKFIPEFSGGERNRIVIRHLLTHTSGLPDMLPENIELRKRHAPLSEFVAGTCRTPLLFSPGAKVHYQSMGILLASEIVARITQRPFRDFLKTELFGPLGMKQTSLGLGGRKISDLAQCQVPEVTDWDWNSPYWRDLGAPWGGAHSSAGEVTRFLQYFVDPRPSVLKSATAAAMITNQTGLSDPWGLGWMLKPGTFGRACSPRTFGHYGSTGTVAWIDPQKRLSCVLLTTKPAASSRQHLLGPVSDAVSASATT